MSDETDLVTQTCSICTKVFQEQKQYATPPEWVAKGLCFCCLGCMDEHNRRIGHVCGRDPCGPFGFEESERR